MQLFHYIVLNIMWVCVTEINYVGSLGYLESCIGELFTFVSYEC